jgi:haloalkane dehalogenase
MSYEKKMVDVLDSRMAVIDSGSGDPVVLLHGNPTSSYLWRNVIPHLEGLGRVIVPDLIGMGDSDKLSTSGRDSYRFVEHRKYLDALFEQLGLERNIVFVVHDWGSALGFDWANRHRERVRGIAYMEAIVQPLVWSTWPEAARNVFEALRSPAGDPMVLDTNVFVENILPGSMIRALTLEEMTEYRRPFLEPGESRRPTLTWPREIPIDGEPKDVAAIVSDYAEWLKDSDLPKLFINADPGAILTGGQREFARSWRNQTEVTVKGVHFIQEDSPDDIGTAIAGWLGSLGATE